MDTLIFIICLATLPVLTCGQDELNFKPEDFNGTKDDAVLGKKQKIKLTDGKISACVKVKKLEMWFKAVFDFTGLEVTLDDNVSYTIQNGATDLGNCRNVTAVKGAKKRVVTKLNCSSQSIETLKIIGEKKMRICDVKFFNSKVSTTSIGTTGRLPVITPGVIPTTTTPRVRPTTTSPRVRPTTTTPRVRPPTTTPRVRPTTTTPKPDPCGRSNPCQNGLCTQIGASAVCTCDEGYTGQHCDDECSPGTYGINCSSNCSKGCNDACDSMLGDCNCKPGYLGPKCEEPCPPGSYGADCSSNCSLGCSDTCDPVDGSCSCKSGYFGDKCKPCQAGNYGLNCNSSCSRGCKDTCNPVDGTCNCTVGYIGDTCNETCPSGSYGEDCSSFCGSGCDDTCDPVNGTCSCTKGYIGDTCNEKCSPRTYGADCSSSCSKGCNDTCDPVNGTCSCTIGYIGDTCNEKCSHGKYGHNCRHSCSEGCKFSMCNVETGECRFCKQGWIHSDNNMRCDQTCPPGSYGADCSSSCSTGCDDICNFANGSCSCKPGYTGTSCVDKCINGTYGESCSSSCSRGCSDTCNFADGSCICKPGYTGTTCVDKCQDGTYGAGCNSNCSEGCVGGACDHVNGSCSCIASWAGAACEQTCAKGTYGLNCNSSCSTGCSDTCDPANGSCSCKPGYSGHLCNNECSQAEGCTSLCGEGCKLGNCNTRDGTCGHPCKEGWKGTKCESRIIYCPAAVYNTTAGEFSLSRTAVGETFSTGTCHVDDKALVEVQCSPGRPREGNWSTFSTNKACDYSDLNHTDTSTKLRNALNGSKDGDIEKVIHLAANVTKNTTLNQLDLFLITDILEKAKNLSEVSSSVAEEVLTIYSAVINTSDSTLGDAQERARAPNRILRSVDEITGKIKPGPNGTARVSTDTFVSQVWDLTNPKVSENLPLGLSLSVSDDNQTSSTDSVFNQTLDHSKIDTAILLPSNFLKNIQNDSNGSDIRMSMNVYKDSLLFTKASVNDTKYQLNSKVVAAKIIVDGKEKTSLDGENVTMIFYSEKQDKGVVKECGYWNFTLIDWSTEGCNYSSGESGRDVCTCSHLTNFAVLTVHGGLGENSVHSLTLSVITILGLSLSIMGLSGTLLSFIVFKKLREKRPQQTLFNLALAELCAWLIFLVGITQTQSHAGCTLVAILLHYFLLASFLWMLAEAFLHYLLLVKVQAQGAFTDHYMLKTGIPAWGLPLLPVLIVLAVDPALYRGSDSYCWMSQSSALYAFALPVGLVILFNIIIYVLVVVRVVNMSRGRAQGTKRNKKRELLKIRVPVLCFILFGLSWIFGFLAVFEAKVVFQYLFCITSSTQGFLIFIFFTASNEEVRQLWHRLCCGKKQEHLVPDDRKDLSTSKVSTKTTDDIAETTTSI